MLSAIGAAVARFPDTEEVTGSIPVSRTSMESSDVRSGDFLYTQGRTSDPLGLTPSLRERKGAHGAYTKPAHYTLNNLRRCGQKLISYRPRIHYYCLPITAATYRHRGTRSEHDDSMSLKFFKMLQNYKNRYLSRSPAQQVARTQENLRSPGALSENKNRGVKKYNNMQTGCL